MKKKRSGFLYSLSMKKIKEYQAIPLEKRLAWLYQGNVLRKYYPKKSIEIQEKLRRGEW
jgi:hypothetical protein